MRSVLLLSLLAGAALAGTDALAGDRGPKPSTALDMPNYDMPSNVFDFPTGLRVIMQSDRSYPVVSTFMIVNHGSSDDPPGKDETAHFVEHTWFRSIHGELPPIMDVVQDLGGVFNATTRNDWTDYRTTAASQNLPILLRLESLRLTEFYKGMTEEQTDVEREVIRNEWRRRNEQSTALLFDYLYNVVYPETHPYHSTSTHETIDNIKLADLQAYVDQYYTPENTTLVVVGDFDPGDASSLLFQYLDLSLLDSRLTEEMLFRYPKPGVSDPDPANPEHWRVGAYDPAAFAKGEKKPYTFAPPRAPRITEDRDPVPPLGHKEIVYEKAPVDHKMAVLGWSLPGGFRADNFELVVLGNLAGQFLSGGVRAAYANPNAFGDVGCLTQTEIVHSTLMCYAEIKDKKLEPERVLEKMLDQFAQLYNPENTQLVNLQFSRGRMENMAAQLLTLDKFADIFNARADTIGPFAHYTGDARYYTRSMHQIQALDPATITQLAYEHVRRDRAARLVVEPLPEEEIDVASNASGYLGAGAGDDQSMRTSDDLSNVTPETLAATYLRPDLSKLLDETLPNGLRVIAMDQGEAPLVQVSLLLGGGPYTSAPLEHTFATSNTRGPGTDPLQFAGSTSYPYFKSLLGEAFDYPLSTFVTYGNATRIDVKVPSSKLDGALWLLREEVEGIKPSLDGAGEWKSKLESGLKGDWRKLEWHLADLRNRHLYPGAEWRQSRTWEHVQVAKRFNASTVTSWLRAHLRPDNAVLLIVGNVDAKGARRLAETYFGGWEGSDKAPAGWKGETSPPPMPTAPTQVYLFDDKERTQTDADLLCRLDYRGESDRAAVSVLGSLAGARTFQTLRVEEGLAYSPIAYAYVGDDDAAVLGFTSLTVNKGVGRAVEFFLETARDIQAGNVEESEIILHKLREARGTGIRSQSTDQLADRLTTPLRLGLDWDVIEQGGEFIAEVYPEQLQRLIGPCADHAVVTVRGPEEIIGPQLEERGIAYEVIDPKVRGDELYEAADPKAFARYVAKRARDEAKKKAREAKETAKNEKKKK